MSSCSHHCKCGCKDLGIVITFSSDSGTLQLLLRCHCMGLIWGQPRWNCFSVAVSKPITDMNCWTRQASSDSICSRMSWSSANGPVSVVPDRPWGRTGNLQNRRSALVPVPTFPNSPANLVLGIFSTDIEYAGDKRGGMLISFYMAISFTSLSLQWTPRLLRTDWKAALNRYVQPWT